MKKILLICTFLTVLICTMTSCSHKHQWSEWQVSKAATCTQDGINIRVCDDCGESQSIPVSALGHNYSEWITTKEVSCTQDGLKERTCSCGEKETQTISASGHTFSAWNTIKEATCTDNGSKERKCICGEIETYTIVAKGHNWSDATCSKEEKCSVCGTIGKSALGHTYVDGECSRCGEIKYGTITITNKTPFVVNNTYGYDTSISIEQVDVTQNKSNIKITISGTKTYDENGQTANNFCGFSILVYDESGNIVGSKTEIFTPGVVSQKFTYSFSVSISEYDVSKNYSITFFDRTSL